MKTFKLPDLGEGLPDAVIREWYVKEGQEVTVDQPLAAMETAKALVDVPSPYAGKITKLFGNVGDTIETGKPLIGFEGEENIQTKNKDSGTVVGAIEESETVLRESASGIAVAHAPSESRIKATPAVRALAKKLNVALENIIASGDRISLEDVQKAAQKTAKQPATEHTITAGQKLTPMRQAMLMNMMQSHQEIVPVTMSDDADIHAWQKNQDVTLRLIRAIHQACIAVPIMNAYFDANKMAYQLNESVNIGLAIDTPEGLYVPTLKDVGNREASDIRQQIDRLKKQALERSIRAEELRGANIMLSNFGSIAGKYANPILLPPMVCIVGVGRSRDTVIAIKGEMAIHRMMPLSITVDHRLVTGGEIARFLKVMMDELAKSE